MGTKLAELETGKRGLESQPKEQKATCETTQKSENERRQMEEKQHSEETQFLK